MRASRWRVERVPNTRSLYHLVGPLKRPQGRKRSLRIAIGSGPRMEAIAHALNAQGLRL